MKLQSLVAAFSLVGAVVARDSLAVSGFQANSDGSYALRRSITALYNERGAQWDLYVQALNVMYNKNPDDPDSYWQIAAMHGRPFFEWGHTGGQQGDNWLGYCPHGEDIFLPWHRPYVTLYEQILNDAAMDIAQNYPQQVRQKYVDAAKQLRSPYWDWAAEGVVPPASVPSTVRVTTPNGPQDVSNPLYSYRYPAKARQGAYGQFDNAAGTSRCPNGNYPQTANANLGRYNLKSWLYDVFSRNNRFFYFATTASQGTSLESIHDTIHNEGACGQQFRSPPLSGFDPLFWLHHTNIDRFWAYWQAIHPNAATLDRQYGGASRWSFRSGTTINLNTQMSPFFKDDFSWHTVDSSSSIKTFGIAYEGLEYWRKSDSDMQRDATALINRMYGNSNGFSRRDANAAAKVEHKRYFAQVSVDRAEVPVRPCNIKIELGGHFAGILYVMPLPETGHAYNEISLDDAISALGLKIGQGKKAIAELTKKLKVTIANDDGTVLDITKVKSLKVQIEEANVKPSKNQYEFPSYNTTESHTSFQDGKAVAVASASSSA